MKWTVLHTSFKIKTTSLLFTNILLNFNSPSCVKAKGVVCRQYDGVDRCCTNYRQERGICIPCIGSFGINCSGGICVEGFYGFGCREKCNCTIHEVCDHRIGCRKKVSELSSITTAAATSCMAVIITLGGVILCLFILLLAVVLRSKILLNCLSIHRTHQRENTSSTDTRSQNYESADNQTYVECDPESVTEVRYPENQFEYSHHSEVTSGSYVSPVLPHRVLVQMSLKEEFEKNRKRTGILPLISQRNLLLHNTSHESGYLSAIQRQQNCKNGEESHYADVEEP
ncbi:multiple epidermal growth factor-like domains protein 10 [Saccostrea echinata]|uniref:multiple epidermal growth factor-like domains protein 10 n=1 Tax=Saccostrea echinata TaxID=191078 RepID=UPI002A8077A5|nr:multiple epidermal growth factor-like domains protein 10 [Saccostrea echinata]